MQRREFAQLVGLGVLGTAADATAAAAGAAPARARAIARVAESEKKQWAREHLRGLGSLVMPSFSPDFTKLDEEAVRQDVRHRMRQGFCSTMVSATGATAEQRRRMLEIVRDETRGKMLHSVIVGGAPQPAITALQNAGKMGCTHALVTFPDSLEPETEDQVYAHYRTVVDASPVPVLLYGSPVASLRRFHPSGIPIGVFDRLADHPSVVGMKLTHGMPVGLAFELCERLSDRLLMGPVNLDLFPILGRHYPNIQWSSQWISDAVQSPEKPYGVELLEHVRQRQMDKALTVYWKMLPLIQLVYDVQASLLPAHPWQHMKYYQWVMGGNGGLLPLDRRESVPALDAAARKRIRDTCRQVGIVVDRPDEEFMVGRVAYAKGVRASDLASNPSYT
jgi:4-hydroxy-tetrahydrodipicolinate synthase